MRTTRWFCAVACAGAWSLGVPAGGAAAQSPATPPRTVIVLDASLSMVVRERAGEGGDRRLDVALQDLRATLEYLVRRRPETEIRLLVFGPETDRHADGVWEYPEAAGAFIPVRRYPDIWSWWDRVGLADRAPRGHSRVAGALKRALALAPDRVLLYSDGVPVNARDAEPPAGTAVAREGAAELIGRAREQLLVDLRFMNRRKPPTVVDVVGVGARLQGARGFLVDVATATGGFFVATD